MNTLKSKLLTVRGLATTGFLREKLPLVALIFGLIAGLGGSPIHAAELTVIGGAGDGVSVTAVALRTQQMKTWASGERWMFSLAPEWQIGSWNAQKSGISKQRIVDSSVTGVLTIRPREPNSLPYYLDIGFGLHMLSHNRISEERNFGSSFQFGEFLGIGADFGDRHRYAIAARVQHVSNGGIRRPNPGVTFAQLSLMYRF
jgi:lipid A 3-O-deacylase